MRRNVSCNIHTGVLRLDLGLAPRLNSGPGCWIELKLVSKACTPEVPGSISGGVEVFSALCLEFWVHSASRGQVSSYFNRAATSGDITSVN
jgi:hypothetical protein